MSLRERLLRIERVLKDERARYGPPCAACGYPRPSAESFAILGLPGGPAEAAYCKDCGRPLGGDGLPLSWPAVVVKGVETETSRRVPLVAPGAGEAMAEAMATDREVSDGDGGGERPG